ncbi:DUF29 domain-containing protein [Salmonella enterica subsp. houtenae]|nr:DUF29 domain-containing protein [Salmonella enterica subsp. houtenae]ECD9326200.1 DUF29 domain-containing protein [Salmonella enterica subsp. houtenae]ECJ2521875.1 DUF29 domain-containing protein [Salmonella enterica subsp. houtenae]EDS2905959.1 DUF29 domain-containing protein [Salmonella enterica subsp. houtenae]EDX5633534.1 DUF29 domain-containing protein [Salmonella enterica subsp. houtenae]
MVPARTFFWFYYKPNFRGKSWTLTIKEQRRKIARRLEKSPSLKRELSEMAVESYGDAILSAARETGLDEENFPPEMPWTLADALREDFMPE